MFTRQKILSMKESLPALEPETNPLTKEIKHPIGFRTHRIRQHVNVCIFRIVGVGNIHDDIASAGSRTGRLARHPHFCLPHLETLLVTDACLHLDQPGLLTILDPEIKT